MSGPPGKPAGRRGRPRHERRAAQVTARPTQRDIAQAAGVSQAVVSIVLNGRSDATARVSDATRARVLAAMERLGYEPNPVARRLAGQSNRLLGIYTFEERFPTDTRDFYYQFLIGVEQACEELGYDLLLFTSIKPHRMGRVYEGGINRLRLADGSVLLGRGDDPGDWSQLLADRYPFVFFGRRADVGGQAVPYVTGDYAEAAAEAVGRLLDAGHRQVRMLINEPSLESAQDLVAGFYRAFEARGLPVDPRWKHDVDTGELPAHVVTEFTEGGATAAVVRDLGTLERLEEALARAGLGIPGDVSVVMLGEWRFGVSRRDWSGFEVPRRQIAREAIAWLVERLERGPGLPPARVLVPCVPRLGETVAPPPAGR
ncbi:MAG: LacI family DNA-binding transcriptional regulator [Conexibacter sp.]